MEETKATTTMVALTPQNYNQWLKELKGIAEAADVWEFCDPDGHKIQPRMGEPPDVSEYQVAVPQISIITEGGAALPARIVTRQAIDFDELSEGQQRSLQSKMSLYQMKEKRVGQISVGMRIVNNALKASARTYIPEDDMDSTIREIITVLATRYKRSDAQIAKQIKEKFQALRQPPPRQKIEKWIAEWENLRGQIRNKGLAGIFGDEEIFVNEFLDAGSRWAPGFCEAWVRSLRAAQRNVDFYEAAREYRLAVESYLDKESSRGVGMANAATLQEKGQSQAQEAPESTNQKAQKQQDKDKKGTFDEKRRRYKDRHPDSPVCTKCDLQHPTNWPACDVSGCDQCHPGGRDRCYILHPELKRSRSQLRGNAPPSLDDAEGPAEGPAGDHSKYLFANTVRFGDKALNPLIKSVVYDSGCNRHLTCEKSRFIGDIEVEKGGKSVKMPYGEMPIVGYGTMVVKATLHGRPRDLLFPGTAYVPLSTMTLISVPKLKREGFIWNMHTDCLEIKSTGQNICDIYEKHGLPVIEYNSVRNHPSFANAVQPKILEKATTTVPTDQSARIPTNHTTNKQQVAVSSLTCKKAVHCKDPVATEAPKQLISTNDPHLKDPKTSSNVTANGSGGTKGHSQGYYQRLGKETVEETIKGKKNQLNIATEGKKKGLMKTQVNISIPHQNIKRQWATKAQTKPHKVNRPMLDIKSYTQSIRTVPPAKHHSGARIGRHEGPDWPERSVVMG